MGDERRNEAGDDSWTDIEEAPPDLVEAVPIRHGMVLGGRYAIERIIGRGGSGVVVRAHDRDLSQVVAIKIVRAELAGQRVWATRLAREVRLARQINHPNVCRVFDFQQADGRVFLVMELAKGTLRDEIRRGRVEGAPAGGADRGRARGGVGAGGDSRRRDRAPGSFAPEPAPHGRRPAGAVGLRPGDRRQREHQRPRWHDRVHGARGDAGRPLEHRLRHLVAGRVDLRDRLRRQAALVGRRGAGDPDARARAEADGGGEGGARRVPRLHDQGSAQADRGIRGGAHAGRAPPLARAAVRVGAPAVRLGGGPGVAGGGCGARGGRRADATARAGRAGGRGARIAR